MIRRMNVKTEEDGVLVDMTPNMLVREEDWKPTEKHPDIKVRLGTLDDKNFFPSKIKYPENYDVDEIVSKSDVLFSKMDSCPMCQRRKAEILARIKKSVEAGKSVEEKRDFLEEAINAERVRFGMEPHDFSKKFNKAVEEPKKVEVVEPEVELKPEPVEEKKDMTFIEHKYSNKVEKPGLTAEIVGQNVGNALMETRKAIEGFLRPPQIVWPNTT